MLLIHGCQAGLLYASGRQKVTFCSIKSLLFNGSCSNNEHFSLNKGHIFSAKFENSIFKNVNVIYLSIIKHCGFRQTC